MHTVHVCWVGGCELELSTKEIHGITAPASEQMHIGLGGFLRILN